MKEKNFNIIIPAIEIDEELLNCLKSLKKINYKNFVVTVVLDKDKKKKIPKFKFKINKMIAGKVNMSKKRNLAAKRFKSDYIAFLDSDAHPNPNWLKQANSYFSKEKNLIIGGPSIPFPKQTYNEMLCHYCKRSFFLNGNLAYRKYMSKKKYTDDWLESCNLLLSRDFFLKNDGQNEKFYIGEDQEFFRRIKKNNENFKTLFCPKLFIYHRERNIKDFFLQRFSYGMNVFSAIDFSSGLKGLLVVLPFSTLIMVIGLFFFNLDLKIILLMLASFIVTINLLIIFNIRKYLSSPLKIILVIILLNFLNLTYAIAGTLVLFGLRSAIEKKIYRKSRLKS